MTKITLLWWNSRYVASTAREVTREEILLVHTEQQFTFVKGTACECVVYAMVRSTSFILTKPLR